MKAFFKTHYKKIIVLASDVLCVLAALICAPLSRILLEHTNNTCFWEVMGGKCATCGGTHFVNDFLSGRFAAAFMDNQLLFCMTVYLLATLLVLNLYWLFDLAFAKKILKVMYNIPVLIIFGVALLAFLIWRNIPLITNLVTSAYELILSIN